MSDWITRDWYIWLKSLRLVIETYELYFILFIFWLYHTACRILVPWPGIEPVPPVLKAGNANLWTTSEVAQLCPTLYDAVDCSWQGFKDHGIFQARVLEWVAISFSRGSSQPRDRTQVSRIVGRRLTLWATREVAKYFSHLYSCQIVEIIFDAFSGWV